MPNTDPSSAYVQVVPDWRYIEKVWYPVLTDATPSDRTVVVFRFQIS